MGRSLPEKEKSGFQPIAEETGFSFGVIETETGEGESVRGQVLQVGPNLEGFGKLSDGRAGEEKIQLIRAFQTVGVGVDKADTVFDGFCLDVIG